ncbi:dethiobiotin synthase [Dermabacteraceae bacterium CCM 9519]
MTVPEQTGNQAVGKFSHTDPLRCLYDHAARECRRGITFVTGTDTEVGKTIATAAVARGLLRAGERPLLVKPAQSGLLPGEEGDVALAARLAGVAQEDALELQRLRDPLAPASAARREGKTLIAMPELARQLAEMSARHDGPLLVEGAGGITVALDNEGRGLLECGRELVANGVSCRYLVVARAGLGTLNHTRLTVAAIRAAGLEVGGVIIGSLPGGKPDLAVATNLAEIADFCEAPLWGGIPEGIGEKGFSY